jgi:hypothetical protein
MLLSLAIRRGHKKLSAKEDQKIVGSIRQEILCDTTLSEISPILPKRILKSRYTARDLKSVRLSIMTNAPHVRHVVTAYLEAGPFKKTLVATLSG